MVSGFVGFAAYLFAPSYYVTFFWVRFLIIILAEFAVLVEVSDQIFAPYPAIRQVGCFLTMCICGAFLFAYVIPPFAASQPPDFPIHDLIKTTSLVKGVIIIALLGAARYFRLPLGRNISGIILGFSLYLGINFANFAVREKFGPALYGRTFSIIGPVSYILCMLVWTVALWRAESTALCPRSAKEREESSTQSLGYQLERFNTSLIRLLRR